jgi:hypothetical protein
MSTIHTPSSEFPEEHASDSTSQEEQKQPVTTSKGQKRKRTYNIVNLSERKQLIHMIDVEKMTIKDAAEICKINYSTAKHIYKLY